MDGSLGAGSSCRVSSPLLSCRAGFPTSLSLSAAVLVALKMCPAADVPISWPVGAEVTSFRPCLTPCDQTSVFHLGTSPIIPCEDNEQRLRSGTCYRKSCHRAMGGKFHHFQQRSLKKTRN